MKKYFTMLFSFVLFFSIAGVVSAAEPDEPADLQSEHFEESLKIESSNGEVITLNSDELKEFTDDNGDLNIESSDIEKNDSLSTLATNDWARLTWKVEVYSGVKIHLYDWEYQLYWEFDGKNITKVSKATKPSIKSAGWRYEGRTDNSYYSNGKANYRTTRTGHFTLGIGGWDAQHMYPYVTYNINAKGGWSAAKGT